ncbi:hypothetical protein ASG67_16640 [Sphingomonas sp. Leaf339]|uniref:hypothetical protein n=1 Tax=Sphingomonas sp. Leaf339 TaxID=1736343 RepID=UPI0006FD7FEC|nr:hypothetical protein [Sphingomonas sp. Leaf339]KQU59155.1 hypothetical protein ASG67_16640 [Sphingomonas sp. Leaf339]
MNRSLPFAVLAGASLFSATAAVAVSPQAKPAPKTAATAAHRTTAVHMTTTTRTTTTVPAGKGRMVTATLANGKTVTYNCSLPGNASKQACK